MSPPPRPAPLSGRRALLWGAAVVGLLLGGWALLRWAGPLAGGPGATGGSVAPTRPPGADDALNRPVLVEAGTFRSGSDTLRDADIDPASAFYTGDEDRTRRAVRAFWIQEHEVTHAEYRRFDPDHGFPAGKARHPVAGVTWEEASAYARSLGGRLPTEYQWEFAARGTESRKYPWGDAPPTCERAHFAACEPRGTIEVMSRPAGATPEGVHDLAGNVWEWVRPDWLRSWMAVNEEARRLRGGSFRDAAFFLRAANRNNDFHYSTRGPEIGFRVVWPAEE